MSDEVPSDGLTGQLVVFGEEFLDIILPDVRDPGAARLPYLCCRKGLGHRYQRYILRTAGYPPAGSGDPGPNPVNIG